MALRLGGALKELRIHLCQTSKQSEGVREFIKNNYVNIKKENPSFPILIRECSGVMPCVWARYERGVECHKDLCDLSADQVMGTITELAQEDYQYSC
ncbi:NADH-ubiquinone oxidoreductase B8 subunit [Operophtera brumata]|uniref:NADH dehydrogenase [ubiquinone] 1 alpha subcomplex subunit 2 n=1 Tax=Operophtera brumata TaxID=104452 RepID=A0A0L7LL10_OPEBR|nr:NADH-ubiquinone oxidoreductase B8 subunit [Operophtera brumata]